MQKRVISDEIKCVNVAVVTQATARKACARTLYRSAHTSPARPKQTHCHSSWVTSACLRKALVAS